MKILKVAGANGLMQSWKIKPQINANGLCACCYLKQWIFTNPQWIISFKNIYVDPPFTKWVFEVEVRNSITDRLGQWVP